MDETQILVEYSDGFKICSNHFQDEEIVVKIDDERTRIEEEKFY